MPKLTQLPIISTVSSLTSFLVTNNELTRRVPYNVLKADIVSAVEIEVSTGQQGPTGPTGTTGPIGPTGTTGTGVPIGGTSGQALVKLSNTDYDTGWTTVLGGGSGSGLKSRENVVATTTSIANNATANLTFTGHKGYILYKIAVSHSAFVTVYSDVQSRTNDALRSEVTDPLPGTGIIAEVITSGNQTIKLTPAVVGFNDESTPTTSIPVRVKNLSGSAAVITVTLTLLGIEQ